MGLNPPVDASRAISEPDILFAADDVQVMIGPAPDPADYRFVVLVAGDHTFSGYLWADTDPVPAAARAEDVTAACTYIRRQTGQAAAKVLPRYLRPSVMDALT